MEPFESDQSSLTSLTETMITGMVALTRDLSATDALNPSIANIMDSL